MSTRFELLVACLVAGAISICIGVSFVSAGHTFAGVAVLVIGFTFPVAVVLLAPKE